MKKQILFIIITFFLILNVKLANAQLISDINGSPLKQIAYFDLDGSPFLSDAWLKGSVEMVNGKIYNNIDLKYDQIKDILIFRGKNDEEFDFVEPVLKFTLKISGDNGKEMMFKNGFLMYKNFSNQSFYELISTGELSILKKNVKTISENREFNSATVIKKVNENKNIFIARGNKIIASQNDNIKTIANAIDINKSSYLIDFLIKNNLSTKNEEDLKKIIIFYNSINN